MTPLDVIAAVVAILAAASVVGVRALVRRRRSRRRCSIGGTSTDQEPRLATPRRRGADEGERIR